jgi:hypothetical protein
MRSSNAVSTAIENLRANTFSESGPDASCVLAVWQEVLAETGRASSGKRSAVPRVVMIGGLGLP